MPGGWLFGERLTLADLHLARVTSYFLKTVEGRRYWQPARSLRIGGRRSACGQALPQPNGGDGPGWHALRAALCLLNAEHGPHERVAAAHPKQSSDRLPASQTMARLPERKMSFQGKVT